MLKIKAKKKKDNNVNIFKTVVLDMHKKGLDSKYIAMELRIPYRDVLNYIESGSVV